MKLQNLHTNYMTKNDCFIANEKIVPKGIMVHSTATPGVMAKEWFVLWNKSYNKGETDRQVCVHSFIDDNVIYQYLPWDHRGWHCGGSANGTHVAFEICEPSGFKYDDGHMVGYDVKKNEPYFRKAWDNAVALATYLCITFNLTEKNIIDHSKGHELGIASGHKDVMHWFPKHNESMDTFRNAVKILLENSKEEEEMRYNNINELPEWAKATIQKLIDKGLLQGSGNSLNLSEDMVRMLVINDRAGLYK